MDSPFPPDLPLDSTSDLLAALHLIDRSNRSKKSNNMDDMDTDLVLEVPDTPDRLATAHSPSGRTAGHATNTYTRRRKDPGARDVGNDTELMLRRARLKLEGTGVSNGGRKSAETIDLGQQNPFPLSHPTRRRDGRRRNGEALRHKRGCIGLDGEDAELKPRVKGKGIDLSSDPQAKTVQLLSSPSHLDPSQRKMGQGQLGSIGYLSPCNSVKSGVPSAVDGQTAIKPIGGEAISSLAGISDQDNWKGVDMHRHGHYVARDNGVLEEGERADGVSSHQINIVSPVSEGSHVNKKKGKVKLDDNSAGNMQHVKAKTRSGRVCSTSDKEVTVVADVDDTPRSSEDLRWRTTRNRTKKASTYPSHEIAGASNREDTNNQLSEQSHEIVLGDRSFVNLVHDSPEISVSHCELTPSPGPASSELELENRRRQRRQKLMKGKKKCSSLRSTSGESSSSVFEDSEISYLPSSGQSSNSKSTRILNSQRRGTILGPVIEIEELHSPEVRCSSPQEQSCRVDDISPRARQVESDEILARRLQEQFYHESPGFGGTGEIDETIAWSLQEEEDARPAVSVARRGQSHPRDASVAHLYAHYPRASFRNASAQLANRARVPTSSRLSQSRRNFNSSEVDLETRMLAHLRRNFNSAAMDGEMRLNFLEALEAAFDNSNDMVISDNFLQDFDEDDYEMLLTLDDNNHQHVGASESQINSLPQSVIQSDSIGEACAICLEIPSVGDIVRHLPCLHKFHKDCIDTWLRRRTSCPICKSGIT